MLPNAYSQSRTRKMLRKSETESQRNKQKERERESERAQDRESEREERQSNSTGGDLRQSQLQLCLNYWPGGSPELVVALQCSQ